jgi:hypothetical protein
MTRRGKIITAFTVISVVIVAIQLWGPEPKECDGPCSGWEWSLVGGLAIFAVIVLGLGLGISYALWNIVKARRRQ